MINGWHLLSERQTSGNCELWLCLSSVNDVNTESASQPFSSPARQILTFCHGPRRVIQVVFGIRRRGTKHLYVTIWDENRFYLSLSCWSPVLWWIETKFHPLSTAACRERSVWNCGLLCFSVPLHYFDFSATQKTTRCSLKSKMG